MSQSGGSNIGSSGGGEGVDDDADRGTLRVRTLQKFLAGYKQVDQGRVAAFAKRLAGTALMAEAGEAVGALGVTRQLLAAYPRTRCLLENERVGTGVFNMAVDDPETAVGLAAVLWDLTLLRYHYHPAVSAAAAEVADVPLQGSVPPALGSHAPAELARLHSTTRGNFRPAIPPPKPGKKARNSVLDRTTSRGGEKRVLDLGPELSAWVRVDAKRFKVDLGGLSLAGGTINGLSLDSGSNLGGVEGGGAKTMEDTTGLVATLRRHFLETKEFGVNTELRR